MAPAGLLPGFLNASEGEKMKTVTPDRDGPRVKSRADARHSPSHKPQSLLPCRTDPGHWPGGRDTVTQQSCRPRRPQGWVTHSGHGSRSPGLRLAHANPSASSLPPTAAPADPTHLPHSGPLVACVQQVCRSQFSNSFCSSLCVTYWEFLQYFRHFCYYICCGHW